MAGYFTLEADSVLRDRAFMRLLIGRVTATLATQIQSVVVGWQLYAMTRDPLTLGWVGLAQFLPMALLVLPAGDAADRLPRRLILTASWLVQAIAGVLFLVLTLSGTESPIGFFAVLVLFGTHGGCKGDLGIGIGHDLSPQRPRSVRPG